MYISRYAINGWGVLFLQEAKGFSDKLCKGDRKLPALLFGILNSVALTLFLYGGTEVWVCLLYTSRCV